MLLGFFLFDQVLGIDEQVAGINEGLGRLLFSNPHNEDACLPDAGSQTSVIAVRRDQAEAIDHACVQDVHCIDDHGAVGGVFANSIAELLDGLEGVIVQGFLPGIHAVGGPVAIDPADGYLSVAACALTFASTAS